MNAVRLFVLLQLFWASFAVIGAGELLLAWRLSNTKQRRRGLWVFLRKTHPLVAALSAFACGVATFGIVIIPAFFLEWKITVLEVAYLVALAGSLGVIVWQVKACWRWMRTFWRRLNKTSLLLGQLVGLVLLADYILSLRVGAPFMYSADVFVHLGKIQMIANEHFSLSDPFFGQNGVVESRYHVNIILALNALAAKLLHIRVVDMWNYSLAFWRLIAWLGAFATAWTFLHEKVRRRWSYIVLLIVPVLSSLSLYYADYPDKVVVTWSALLLIGLKVLLDTKSPIVLFVAVWLLGLTHPAYSLIAAGFLVMSGLAMLVTKKLGWRNASYLAGSLIALGLPALLTLHYPNRMGALTFNEANVHLAHVGPFLVALPIAISRKWTFWAVTGLSLIGYGYIIYKIKDATLRLLLGLLVIYYGLVVYNPLFLSATKHTVPLWLIERFHEFNRLTIIAAPIGGLAIVEGLASLLQRGRRAGIAVGQLAVIVLLGVYGMASVKAFHQQAASYRPVHAQINELQTISDKLKGQKIIADKFTEFVIPTITTANVVDIQEQHASPVSNAEQRLHCGNQLRAFLDLPNLQAAGVTRVLSSGFQPGLATIAYRYPEYLTYDTQVGGYTLFDVHVDKNESFSAKLPCAIPYGQ